MIRHMLPPPPRNLTKAVIEKVLRGIRGDAKADPTHPLLNVHHEQHREFVKRILALEDAGRAADSLTAGERDTILERLSRIVQTPGFLSGELADTNAAEHIALEDERQRLVERLHGFAPAEVLDPEPRPLTGGERMDAQEAVEALLRTPGYIDGSLKRRDPREHEGITARLSELYAGLHAVGPTEGPAVRPDEGDVDVDVDVE